jgi:hypothetical protein
VSTAGKAAQKRLRDAKKAVERAELARREAFRKALVALFNEYRLCLEADGDLSAHLTIKELPNSHPYPIEDLPK